jgi:hypothetical protein
LRFASDGAEESAGCFLERLDCAIWERIAFLAPKFPADIARDILGVEFQTIQHEPRRLHDIMTNSVTGHPRDFVFRHGRDFIEGSYGSQVASHQGA